MINLSFTSNSAAVGRTFLVCFHFLKTTPTKGVLKNSCQKHSDEKFMLQLVIAKEPRYERSRLPIIKSFLYLLFWRRTLILLALLPRRLNDVIYAQ